MDWTDDFKMIMRNPVEPPAIAPEDYREVLLMQLSTDLAGVAMSFSRILKKIWDESRRHGQGSDWVSRHPICRLYGELISHLTQVPQGFTIDDTYDTAYKFCEAEALKTLKEGERAPWRT